MNKTLLDDFWKALHRRNPALVDSLQPGLPEKRIREMLGEAEVRGSIQPVVNLFGWRNGARPDPNVTLEEASPFPESVYGFPDLETLIEHFRMFHDGFVYHPKFEESHRRYFPLFWDNSTGYLAVDLRSSAPRVVLLDPESEDLARDAYDSFEEFVRDAIRANKDSDNLTCFQIR